MKKTTKILAVAITVAILFATLSIGAFADDITVPYEKHYLACFNNDIFDCWSEMSIENGNLRVDLFVRIYAPNDEPAYDEYENILYSDYVPTGESYSVSLSVMTVLQIYNEDMTTEWTYGGGSTNGTPPHAGETYQLQSNVPYQYVATENYIVITSSTGATYEVFSNSIAQFWT